jgi:glycosyltransferase involved in cell wall biosynthesis
MKFAILSHAMPPSRSGQAIVLHKLLSGMDTDDYCLISQRAYENCSDRLDATSYYLKTLLNYPLPPWYSPINAALNTFYHAWQVLRIIKCERCKPLIVCTGYLSGFPASYIASAIAHIPYVVYIFDDYMYQWTGPSRYFARIVEPTVLRCAAGVIVPNEFLQEELLRRYRIRATVVHNPTDLSINAEDPKPGCPASHGEVKIVYTGSVYNAHYGAFRNLIVAINMLESKNVKLHIYTRFDPRELIGEHISGPVEFHAPVDNRGALDIQRDAEILFLPLAFNSAIPEVIKTASPGKMGEYLASGKPILVHAPSDSYVSWYFREHDCGVVVDENDPRLLSRALAELISNDELKKRISSNALAMAKKDFDVRSSKKEFMNVIRSVTCKP